MKIFAIGLVVLPLVIMLCSCRNEESEPQWMENAPEASQQGASDVPSQLPDYGSSHSDDHGNGHR